MTKVSNCFVFDAVWLIFFVDNLESSQVELFKFISIIHYTQLCISWTARFPSFGVRHEKQPKLDFLFHEMTLDNFVGFIHKHQINLCVIVVNEIGTEWNMISSKAFNPY